MKFVWRAVLLGTLSPAVYAADLMEVYQDAQQNDATFKAAQAAYQAALEKVPQARAGFLPNVNLTANTHWNELKRPDVERRKYNSREATLQLTQPIFRMENFANMSEAQQQVAQAQAQLEAAKQDLMQRTAQAYFDVLQARDAVEFSGAQKAAFSEQLAVAKRNFEVGASTVTDTHEAQAKYDLSVAQEINAVNELEVKRRTLEQLIAKYPPALAPVAEKLPLAVPEPNNMDAWVQAAEQQNPQLAARRAAAEIAGAEVKRARAGHFPALDFVASYSDSKNATTVETGELKAQTVGLNLNIPLFQGGLVSSRVREAKANQERARQETEEAKRQVDLQARQAFLGVTNGMAQVKANTEAVRSNQLLVESTRTGFSVGVKTNVDVLNAAQLLYAAKRDLSQARYNYLLNHLKLKQAAGTLSEQDLAAINQWVSGKAK